jgi:aspartyl-tRNA(Asn)/glutamyl-tRNA(Gln) amidotransferase subunit B
MSYKPVIGLEIHVELKTKSKMFCQCSADYFDKKPNSNTCPVCLGLPGALPVPNKTAIDWVIKLGLALGCEINMLSKFDRKHYSYPDLPKGYQISQYDLPFAINGLLNIRDTETKLKKSFRIHRIHLEEDTGKLQHDSGESRVDFNRSSVPLVEIVTEPDFDSSDDVKAFLQELYTIVRYLDISDADMEKGSMRMEPNISVRRIQTTLPDVGDDENKVDSAPDSFSQSSLKTPVGSPSESVSPTFFISLSGERFELPPYKVEVKNINSFRFVKQAIDYEVKRHIEILEKGEIPAQETRGFDEKKVSTYAQRRKENAADYRYFPDPDIPPIRITDKDLGSIKNSIPELPAQKMERIMNDYQIKYEDAFILTRERALSEFYEKVLKLAQTQGIEPQKAANWLINKKITDSRSVEDVAKEIVSYAKPKETNLDLLEEISKKTISDNLKVIQDIKSGKGNAIMFLVGQVMKEMKGQADAQTVKKKLEELLVSSQ